MDKKIGIIIGILVVAIVGLIVFAFMADSKDPYIVKLNDVGYDKQDFETYYKIRYVEEEKKLENGSSEDLPEVTADGETVEPDNSEESSSESLKEVNKEELKDTAWTEYLNAIFLNQLASEKGYTASSDLEGNILSNYNSESTDKAALEELGVT